MKDKITVLIVAANKHKFCESAVSKFASFGPKYFAIKHSAGADNAGIKVHIFS